MATEDSHPLYRTGNKLEQPDWEERLSDLVEYTHLLPDDEKYLHDLVAQVREEAKAEERERISSIIKSKKQMAGWINNKGLLITREAKTEINELLDTLLEALTPKQDES